jgi:hypothetical protein
VPAVVAHETASLASVVPQLPAEALHALIRHRGPDGSTDLVAAATPEQLTAVFDIDLWRRPSSRGDERFDDDRFGEWVEALVDSSEVLAARIVATLDEDLVVAGLSRYVRVFDAAVLATPVGDGGMDFDVPIFSGLSREVGGYVVRARRTESWDAIVLLFAALAEHHPERFHGIMSGCRRLSNSTPEIDGLDNLLTEPEQVMYDVAAERDRRRVALGYVTPADARAFLQTARDRRHDGCRRGPTNAGSPQARELVGRIAADEAAFTRSRQLAFLANVLLAGCSVQSRAFTPQEASDAARAICNLGLERWPGPDAVAAQDDLVATFEVGWAVLHDLSLTVAAELAAALGQLECVDAEIQEGLRALRRELARQCRNATPWLAHEALDVLAMVDLPACVSVQALLQECPVVTDALVAILERRTGAISQTAFEFISTERQIALVREFAATLPEILMR